MSNIETIEPQPKPPAAPVREASAIKEAIAGASSSLRIIAIGVVFAFMYWASSIVIAVLLSVLLAYFLDPFVTFLEHVHIPRALGALLVLLAATAAIGALGYMALGRLDTFVNDWPRYSAVLKRTATSVDRSLSSVDQQVADLTSQKRVPAATAVENAQPVRTLLLRGLGSLYSILLVWTFLPFLVFFMLAAKRKIWQSTLGLFPEGQRQAARETLNQVSSMLRSYIVGNALVAAILITACAAFFWSINLDYPVLMGVVAGSLNMIPYLGVVLSWLPPFVIGLTHWKTAGPFLGVAGALTGLHLLAMNVLMPAIVGRRVHLNAVAVTIALLFWGWLWGAAGLILAIPITAVLKVICDHVPSWQPTGRWLGS
jgi:predicted PurR-regulated permease PerM